MPNPPMIYSKTGLELTKRFEGCKLTSYKDTAGVLTIGYGHTGPEVCEGLAWTQEQADAALIKDTAWATTVVNDDVNVPLTQGEFDALVDFVFNAGSGNFRGSTMLKLLNEGDYAGAAAQFDRWDYAGGKEVAGLLRRRQDEEAEFKG